MQFFVGRAIADSTRRTYEAPTRAFREYCAQRGVPHLPFTTDVAAEWLASVAQSGKHSAATIRTYRSAISTMHAESEWGGTPNPVASEVIERLMRGIARAKAESDAAARAARPRTIELTPALMLRLEPVARGDSPEEIMKWAAACTAVFALLRPSELLGSPQHRDRALRPAQITFFARPGEERTVEPSGGAPAVPDRFEIALGATKTSQLGGGPARIVAARPAVQALWRWMCLREAIGADGPELFRAPKQRALATTELLAFLCEWLRATGHGAVHLTGKAFRRGGASGLIAGGVPRADAAAAGGWKSLAMLDTYASAQAKKERAAAVSRGMAP